jgi:hypothetical protein
MCGCKYCRSLSTGIARLAGLFELSLANAVTRVGPPIPCLEPFPFGQGVSVNTFSNSELVMEGLRVAANTHIEPEIDMIQIMDVSN